MAKRREKFKSIKLPRAVKRLFPKVEYATDSNVAVEVAVSKKDCDESESLNPAECALAHAAKRELDADGVIIGISSSYVIKGKQAIRFATPASVQREIVSFDRHHDFAPGNYNLVPKAPSMRLGEGRKPRKNHSNPNKEVRREVHKSARIRILPGHEGA